VSGYEIQNIQDQGTNRRQ